MRDPELAALIERIIDRSQITGRERRDDLRRELWTHFDEADASADPRETTLRRFGAESLVADAFRRVYRADYMLLYAAKIGASLVVSAAAALVIEAIVNLRVEVAAEVWRLAPGFSHAASLAVVVVLALVAAGEAAKSPFDLRRAATAFGTYGVVAAVLSFWLPESLGVFVTATLLVAFSGASAMVSTRLAKMILTFLAFAVAEYAMHRRLHINFGPARAAAAGAVLVAVWASTIAIVSGLDRVFASTFRTSRT